MDGADLACLLLFLFSPVSSSIKATLQKQPDSKLTKSRRGSRLAPFPYVSVFLQTLLITLLPPKKPDGPDENARLLCGSRNQTKSCTSPNRSEQPFHFGSCIGAKLHGNSLFLDPTLALPHISPSPAKKHHCSLQVFSPLGTSGIGSPKWKCSWS